MLEFGCVQKSPRYRQIGIIDRPTSMRHYFDNLYCAHIGIWNIGPSQNYDRKPALETCLSIWSKRADLKETSGQSALIDAFFRDTWGYVQTGHHGSDGGFTLYPKFPIPGAGARGGRGEPILPSAILMTQRSVKFLRC